MYNIKIKIVLIIIIISYALVSCGDNPSSIKMNEVYDSNIITQTVKDNTSISPTPVYESTNNLNLVNTNSEIISTMLLQDIRNTKDRIMVCNRLNGETSSLMLEFSILDFSKINDDSNVDLSIECIQFPIQKNYQHWEIMNIQFYDDNNSFIYLSYDWDSDKTYLYNYSDGFSRKITNYSTAYAQVSPNGKNILFITRDLRMYVIDFSGNGREFASNIAIQGQPVFSPDGKYIAFVGEEREAGVNKQINDFSNFILYMISLDEPNNPITTGLDTKIGDFISADISTQKIAWSLDSRNIYFIRENSQREFIVCYSIYNVEKCFYDHVFTYIEDISVSKNDLIAISGKTDPIDLSHCHECTMKDLDTDLFILEIKTSELTKILDNDYAEQAPMFINDDKYILYEASPSGVWQVFITDTTGSFYKQLTFSDESSQFKRLCVDN